MMVTMENSFWNTMSDLRTSKQLKGTFYEMVNNWACVVGLNFGNYRKTFKEVIVDKAGMLR